MCLYFWGEEHFKWIIRHDFHVDSVFNVDIHCWNYNKDNFNNKIIMFIFLCSYIFRWSAIFDENEFMYGKQKPSEQNIRKWYFYKWFVIAWPLFRRINCSRRKKMKYWMRFCCKLCYKLQVRKMIHFVPVSAAGCAQVTQER